MALIFGYGSLMWNPGFRFLRKFDGVELIGYHREFNKKSTTNWGTPGLPAPTLGLEKGGACVGVAFEISDEDYPGVKAYLEKREGPSFEIVKGNARIEGRVCPVYFPLNRHNHTYIGGIPLERRAEMIIAAKGTSGACVDYVRQTLFQLERMHIKDRHVEKMWDEVSKLIRQRKLPIFLQIFSLDTIRSYEQRFHTQLLIGLPPSLRSNTGKTIGETITLIGPRHIIGHKHIEAVVVEAREGQIVLTEDSRKGIGIDHWKQKTIEVQPFRGILEFIQIVA